MSKPNLPIPPSYADEEEEAEQLVTTEEEDEESEPFNDLPDDDSEKEEKEEQEDLEEDQEDGDEEELEEDVLDNELLNMTPKKSTSLDTNPSLNSFFSPSEDEWQVGEAAQGEMEEALAEEQEDEDEPIDIREVETLTPIEASEFAEYVLQVLEEDLAAYTEKTGISFDQEYTPEELKRKKLGLKDDESVSSFKSVWSDVLPGDPSRVRLTYEKGTTVSCTDLGDLSADRKSDKDVQVNLHRPKKQPNEMKDGSYVQTLEMTFQTAENASIIFKDMYPDTGKLIDPPAPTASEDIDIKSRDQADPNVDTIRKVSGVVKEDTNKPFVEHYYKEEKFPDGAHFKGEFTNMRIFKGQYKNAAGTVFEGEWRDGEYQSGQITFSDGLKFEEKNWKYLIAPDRRFDVEKHDKLKPAGMTLFSNHFPQPKIPPGTYDCGIGYFIPKTDEFRRYDGTLLRNATLSEKCWIVNNCRKVHESMEHIAPKFLAERIPGSYVDSQKRIPITRKYYH